MKTRRFLVVLAGLAAGLLAIFVAPAGPAQAHASLVRTQPVQGSVVQQAPTEIVITFSEQVTPVPEKIKVIAPDGTRADRGKPTVSGDDMHIPLRTDVPRGTFVVSYRVISADSHPVGAAFTYSVGAPSATAPSAASGDAGTTDPVVSTALEATNYLGYAGLILIAGPALFLAALWPARLSRRGPTRLAMAGLGLVGLATVLDMYLEVPYSLGGHLFSFSSTGLTDELTSKFGQAHLARLVIAVAVAALLRPLLAGRPGAARRWMLAVLAAAGAATWGYGTHPGSSSAPLLTVVADAAHLASMAVWIGGLVMLLGYLLRRATARELSAILPVWSNWAALAVTVLVLAGVAQALIEIGTFGKLVHTSYGQLVLLKVGLLALVLAAAAVSRRAVLRHAGVSVDGTAGDESVETPVASRESVGAVAGGSGVAGAGDGWLLDDGTDDLPEHDAALPEHDAAVPDDGADPDPSGGSEVAAGPPGAGRGPIGRLRRSVLTEVIGAVLIIGVASVLVQTTPARSVEAADSGGTASGVFSTTLTSPLYQLQIDVEPAQTGPNDIHMYAYTPVGAPMKILEWHVTATLPAQGIEPVDAVLTPVTDSHEIGQITLPAAGDWQFSFTLRTSEIDEATVNTVVKIT